MNFINKVRKNEFTYLIPFFSAVTLLTWLTNLPQFHNGNIFIPINVLIYLIILLILIIFRVSNTSIIIFNMFALMSSKSPETIMVFGTKFPHIQILPQVIFFASAMYFLIGFIFNPPKIKGKLLIPILCLLGYSTISLIWTKDFMYGLSKILILSQGFLTYIVVTNDQKTKITPYKVSILFSVVCLIMGIQYVIITKDYFPDFIGIGKYHLGILWANPNMVAALIGIIFVPSLYKYISKDKSKYIYLYLPFELLTIYSVWASLSRGLLFGLIVGLASILFLIIFKKRNNLFLFYLGFVFIVMASIFGIVLLKDKFPQFYDNLNKLSTGRFRIYEIGINRLKNPLILIFGEGLGSAHLTLVEHGSYNYYYHSWFLHVLVSGGLISLGLTFWIQKKVFTVVKEHKSKFFYFVAIAVVIYFAHNIIDIGYDYQFLGMYFYFLIAMIENNKKIDLEGGLNINEKDIITN